MRREAGGGAAVRQRAARSRRRRAGDVGDGAQRREAVRQRAANHSCDHLLLGAAIEVTILQQQQSTVRELALDTTEVDD